MSTEFSDAALETIMETARGTVSAKDKVNIVDLPGGHAFLIVKSDGQYELATKPDPQRKHMLLSVEDIHQFVRDEVDRGVGGLTVWIAKQGIFVTLDDRRLVGDRALFEFNKTDEFEFFESLIQSEEAFYQKDFLKILRTRLWNNFARAEDRDKLIKNVRSVRAEQTSTIGNGKGTFEAGFVTNDAEQIQWPDRLVMKCQIFDDRALISTSSLDVVLDVDASTKTFSLYPTVSSLREAENAAREQAVNLLRENLHDVVDAGSVRIYLGQP